MVSLRMPRTKPLIFWSASYDSSIKLTKLKARSAFMCTCGGAVYTAVLKERGACVRLEIIEEDKKS